MRKAAKTDLLRGTLDLMIMQIIALQPLHGIAIADRLRQVTKGTFHVQAGSLFPALHRLEQEGWIIGEWTTNEKERRVRSYTLTASGRKHLAEERKLWNRITTAVAQVLQAV